MKVNSIRKTELEMTTQEKETITDFLDIVFDFSERQADWRGADFRDMLNEMLYQGFIEDYNYGDEIEEFKVKIINK